MIRDAVGFPAGDSYLWPHPMSKRLEVVYLGSELEGFLMTSLTFLGAG